MVPTVWPEPHLTDQPHPDFAQASGFRGGKKGPGWQLLPTSRALEP
jgi:hypothetical protein